MLENYFLKILAQIKYFIKWMHLIFDGWVGRIFYRQSSLDELSKMPHKPIAIDSFEKILYSKHSHFTSFLANPRHRKQSPATCDLKIYQDALVYTFILDNFPPGSKLLEIGGGESRIISALKGSFEIWNLDKLEGEGYGPKSLLIGDGFYLIKDYIGGFSTSLPDNYFDLVFSISTLEHIPDDSRTIDAVIHDIQRLLKPGGYSLHCIDSLLFEDRYCVHKIVQSLYSREIINFPLVTFDTLRADDDVWLLSKYAYYTRWYPIVRKPIKQFGYPFSINILWQAQ